jgi:hypothetical protein
VVRWLDFEPLCDELVSASMIYRDTVLDLLRRNDAVT